MLRVFIEILKGERNRASKLFTVEAIVLALGDFIEPLFDAALLFLAVSVLLLVVCALKIKAWISGRRALDQPVSPAVPMVNEALGNWAQVVPIAVIGATLSLVVLCWQAAVGGRDTGLLAQLSPEIEKMQGSLFRIEERLREINKGVNENKRETSDNARKELFNLGTLWSGQNFMDAVHSGETETIALFIKGGMHPEEASSHGRRLPVMLALNKRNPGTVLRMLVAGGLDVNHEYDLGRGFGPEMTTLLGAAIERGNVELARQLLLSNADPNQAFQTPGPWNLPRDAFPLIAALYCEQPRIADLLLDLGAQPATADYAVYREAQRLLFQAQRGIHVQWIKDDWLSRFATRVSPKGAIKQRIDLEVRKGELEGAFERNVQDALTVFPGDSRYEESRMELERMRQQIQVLEDQLEAFKE